MSQKAQHLGDKNQFSSRFGMTRKRVVPNGIKSATKSVCPLPPYGLFSSGYPYFWG